MKFPLPIDLVTKWLSACGFLVVSGGLSFAGSESIPVRMSWGHHLDQPQSFYVRLIPSGTQLKIQDASPSSLESGEGLSGEAWQFRAGGGDIDGIQFTLVSSGEPSKRLSNIHITWASVIEHGDLDTARRLGQDAAFFEDAPKLTVQMNSEGTTGFSLSVDQLANQRVFWIPSLDAFISVGDPTVSFEAHQRELERFKGLRVLDQVDTGSEATYERFKTLWEDMGSPDYDFPEQRGPGHIVGLTWDSAIHKFGVDRGAGVWPDYGSPDRFRFWFSFADIEQGIRHTWKSQSLKDGLPIVTTVFEEEGTRYEVEQFAYPLNGPPGERRGDIPMVLLQRVRVTDLKGEARQVPITLSHRRQFPEYSDSSFEMEEIEGKLVFRESAYRQGLLAVEGVGPPVVWSGVRDYQRELRRMNATLLVDLPANGTQEFVVKLPSPPVPEDQHGALLSIDYEGARQQTLDFWMDWVNKGAQFEVPEKVVNDLFRANMWHALRLPRRHGGEEGEVKIDLPYSNFAYMQHGIPWPMIHANYIDTMIYDLRGYHEVSSEELLATYRKSQEYDGHLTGVFNWLVYTPGLLWSVAKHYLLSRDRTALDELLPFSIKALDWCLEAIHESQSRTDLTRGLVHGPLNDGTGEGIWAFNQAYLYGGLELFGRVLTEINHPRAAETVQAAASLQEAVRRGFGHATMLSPLVQLKDHTWIPYVPGEATIPGRLLEQWYLTDVDTGGVHLLRFGALTPDDDLGDYLLHDHEDNLFYKNLGMMNEPSYHPQGKAYLLRDEPERAIRIFYSYMASAFSHEMLEPIEVRWTHGQYFGPPATDGAWFELYRDMLIQEGKGESLLLAQATPRRWLEEGKKIVVKEAPTYYGKLSMLLESRVESDEIVAEFELVDGDMPARVLVRFRHPDSKKIRSVRVNGRDWSDFEIEKEWVRVEKPDQRRYRISVSY